jgi:hypothetical protein
MMLWGAEQCEDCYGAVICLHKQCLHDLICTLSARILVPPHAMLRLDSIVAPVCYMCLCRAQHVGMQ